MPEQLQKAINLAKKTGDKIIVFDSAKPDDVFVIVGLGEYEKMLDGRKEVRTLTEDELLDRINRDVAIWKSENTLDNDEFFNLEDSLEDDESEDMYYYEEDDSQEDEPKVEGTSSLEFKEDEDSKMIKNQWRIPPTIKNAADEIIDETPF